MDVIKKTSDEIVNELKELALQKLSDLEDYLYEQNERPSDIYDCGTIDGEYDTWIAVLNALGVEHSFKPQCS
jgi:hypothetical protein